MLSKEDKAKYGKELNILKLNMEKEIDKIRVELKKKEINEKLKAEKIDISLPERPYLNGKIHPISRALDEIISILGQLSFEVCKGPHIENDYNNFTALNISENHPARQDHDTFYFNNSKTLLRTHTSPVQIRVMKSTKPPIRIIAPGATYRCDDDATHSPMFHQVEGLVVDENINMGHLKHLIKEILTQFFSVKDLPMRFRPSYFPFTEPSAEVDIGCLIKENFLKIGEGSEWLEVLGCGMVNPIVLENCGLDSKRYSGFAFGLGIERFAMLKYQIADLRMFYDNDIKWLDHNSFFPKGFPSTIRGF